LFDNNYLSFNTSKPPDSLHNIHPNSRAYSLIPGRVYINLKGREKIGSVSPGLDYERLREELKNRILEIEDNETGEKVVKTVLTREQAYFPDNQNKLLKNAQNSMNSEDPFYFAPDLIVVNNDGYDFKGNLWMDHLMKKGPIVGMHTYENAFLYIRKRTLKRENFSIVDILPTILELFEMEPKTDLHGHSLLN
jgi:predicted AlkP superfamily phosphohydrolase/phosphomutase